MKQTMKESKTWANYAAAMPILVTLAFIFLKCTDIRPWACTGAASVAYIILLSTMHGMSRYMPGLMTVITVVASTGIMIAAIGTPMWESLLAILPVGLISEGIIKSRATYNFGMNTKNDAKTFGILMLAPYAILGIASMAGLLPIYTVFSFLTIAIAIACASTMFKNVGQGDILLADLEARTANLQVLFSLLLALSLIIAK